ELARRLSDARLIDRYNLLVFPVLLGAGKSLSSRGDNDMRRLRESDSCSNGATKLVYEGASWASTTSHPERARARSPRVEQGARRTSRRLRQPGSATGTRRARTGPTTAADSTTGASPRMRAMSFDHRWNQVRRANPEHSANYAQMWR